MSRRDRSRRCVQVGAWSATAAAVTAVALVAAGTGTAAADALALPGCPGLLVIGVQGTGESSPSASPSLDTGMLGTMFGPMLTAGVDIDRVYIGYPASFGGAIGTGPGTASYADSVAYARSRLDDTAAAAVEQCPNTRLAVAGFSQGAAVVSDFAQDVGAGNGPVAPDRVAGVALLSDPTRPVGPDPIPGRPGQVSPDPAPGTDGDATAAIHLDPVPGSGGIADTGTDFNALEGRVGEFCAAGDLACDAPANAAALQVAAGVAAQSDLRDPIAAATSITASMQETAAEASTQVLLNDVTVEAGQVNYVPGQTVSQRLAEASDPGGVTDPAEAVAAADKSAQVMAAIAADPIGQIPRLAGQVGAAIGAELAANADILNPATLAHYAAVITNHTGYGATGETGTAADWFAALSQDLSGGAP
ncbi:cutinase family protein (plasmid) [Nocardia sp. NBC_01377]|uniref:cutinase family protein n=1 Tax=Nocardia sp. NBC_01377 TaxID=2903595 RepID=UPI0032441777